MSYTDKHIPLPTNEPPLTIAVRVVGGEHLPAVRVKVYGDFWRALEAYCGEDGVDPRFTPEWAEKHTDLKSPGLFEFACERGWELIEDEAGRIFPAGCEVESDGRSGGWCVVRGLGEVEGWGPAERVRWRRFQEAAGAIAGDVPRMMADVLYLNEFAAWAQEVENQLTYGFGAFA